MISIQNLQHPTAKAIRSLVAKNFSLSEALAPMIAKSATPVTIQSIVHQMTVLFVTIDDFLNQHQQAKWCQWRRSPNRFPAFTDAEVLTVALLQGCLKVATLKHAYQIVATDFASAFPRLPSYCQFMARLHALEPLVGRLIQQVLPHFAEDVYLLDSKPIPLCKPIRHGRVRLLREDGAYFGKNSCGWYFGFKVHTIAHQSGTILCAFLTPANVHDRDVALALAQAVDGGILLADNAYQTKEMERLFEEHAELTLVTPKNSGQKQRPKTSGINKQPARTD